MTVRTLVIDDDHMMLELVEDHLTQAGHQVTTTSTAAGARDAVAAGQFDNVVCDYDLGILEPLTGDLILGEIQQLNGTDARYILCSGLDRAAPDGTEFFSKANLTELLDTLTTGTHRATAAGRPVTSC